MAPPPPYLPEYAWGHPHSYGGCPKPLSQCGRARALCCPRQEQGSLRLSWRWQTQGSRLRGRRQVALSQGGCKAVDHTTAKGVDFKPQCTFPAKTGKPLERPGQEAVGTWQKVSASLNHEGLDFPETLVWPSLAAHLGLCADPSQVCGAQTRSGVGAAVGIQSHWISDSSS